MAVTPILIPTPEQRTSVQRSNQDIALSKVRRLRALQSSPDIRFDLIEAVIRNFAPQDRVKITSRYSDNIVNYDGGKKLIVRQGTIIGYETLGEHHFYMLYQPDDSGESKVFDFDPVVYKKDFIDYNQMEATVGTNKVTIVYSKEDLQKPSQVGFIVEIEKL